MRAPIVSRKHYVQFTQFITSSASVTDHVIAQGVAIQNVNTASEVTEGSVVKAIFLEVWLLTNNTTAGTFVCAVMKSPVNSQAPTFSEMTTLDAFENKKNILFVSQGVLAPNGGNPTPVLRQWIKIPKGKQRIGLTDRLRVVIAAIGSQDTVGCAFYTYKSYS